MSALNLLTRSNHLESCFALPFQRSPSRLPILEQGHVVNAANYDSPYFWNESFKLGTMATLRVNMSDSDYFEFGVAHDRIYTLEHHGFNC